MSTPARGRPRDPGVDTAILRAAVDLFIARGIDAMSIEQVARRAGVGKPTVYRRWPGKERLVADAIEMHVGADIRWPTPAEIDAVPADELVRRNVGAAARTAADPDFRALVAAVYGSAVSHPLLMQTYWDHYIAPRRAVTVRLLQRAKADGRIAADADLDVLVDMLAGAATYRVLQPDPPDEKQMEVYLETLYRQVGLLP